MYNITIILERIIVRPVTSLVQRGWSCLEDCCASTQRVHAHCTATTKHCNFLASFSVINKGFHSSSMLCTALFFWTIHNTLS